MHHSNPVIVSTALRPSLPSPAGCLHNPPLIMAETCPPEHPSNREGWWTRDHVLIMVLVAATVLLLFLCWKLALPFMGPIAWALALAIVAHPLYGWLAKRIEKPSLAAGLAVLVIALVIVAPAIFVGHNVVKQASVVVQAIHSGLESGQWQEQLARSPRLGPALAAVEKQANLGGQLQSITAEVGKRVAQIVTGSAWVLVELLLTFFVLFYLFRDRCLALASLRVLVPLSERETDEVFTRVSDTIQATIFGTLSVAMVQGTLGGLMFWWLGLPAPILWGAVMALLAIVPVLGAFIIWLPAALFLGATGQWGKAAILSAWGVLAVGLIDNLLYPMLVGKTLRLHTVPVFFAVIGGLALFGAVGLILGPVILALTDAILEIWCRRTAYGRPAEGGSNSS
jgi:predicted PurR-regulated permease PerM